MSNKIKITFLALFIISASGFIQAQEYVIEQTNVQTLEQLASKWTEEHRLNIERAKKEAVKRNLPIRQVLEDGQTIELQRISDRGELFYNTTGNVDAARTIGTDKVWPGGSLGFLLSGDSMIVGEWDGGAVRLTHQELVQRVTQVDNASSISSHATHVAGTMIGSGVDTLARGMAFTGKLDAYDWNSDNSEMAIAASNGLLVSNHSYSYITGWFYNGGASRYDWWGDTTLSATEDYRFGFYESTCANWDQIARNAPYYLILRAAGNDRNDNHTGSHYLPQHGVWSSASRLKDGGTDGYDCISDAGVAKNVLTVGAVDAIPAGYSSSSGVVMTSFSGWGPTDDGRIKPDLVANGLGVYSSLGSNDSAYASWNGTSMATPTVTGSLALIQQHYKSENGVFMKAATLKGLAIHTADEAGSANGPDYSFGWGLFNTSKAVLHISDTTNTKDIIEASLNNNQIFSFNISVTGTSPVRATICWTDIPGTPVSASLNPTAKMLVNDLDIRIKRNSDSTLFNPYILNPASPSSGATTGDNFRDNVEQIYLASPTAGSYTVSISHKGNLNGASTQDFSLILDGGEAQPQQLNCALTIDSFPNEQDFESFTNCSSTSSAPCPLPAGTGWFNDTLDHTDWKIYSGSTPSGTTGPTMDYSEGTTSGKYAYIEASTNGVGYPSKTAILYLPCYNLDTLINTELVFAYHMYGSTMGSLSIEKYNGFVWKSIWSKTGDQGNLWNTATVDLSSFDGDTINLRIVGITGSSFWSDMAIDAVVIREYDPCLTYSPTVTITNTGPSTFCSGDSTILSTSGGTSFQWIKDGLPLNGDTLSTLVITTSGNYNVVLTDSSTCSDSSISATSITVNSLPSVVITPSSPMDVCAGDSVTLTVNSGGTIQWYKDGQVIQGATGGQYTVNSQGNYNVIKTDANVCSDSVAIGTTVNILALPIGSINASSLNICDGQSANLTASAGYSYQWYKNGSILNSETSQILSVTSAGHYNVIFTDTSLCSDSSVVGTDVSVSDLPVVTMSSLPDFCDIGPPMLLTQGAPSGSNGIYKGPGITGGSGIYFFDPGVVGIGIYNLWYVYEDNNLCSDSASQDALVKGCVGIETTSQSDGIQLIPNPSSGQVIIRIENDIMNTYELKILDVSGQIVHTVRGEKKTSILSLDINLDRQSKGLYFVQLQMPEKHWAQKLILD